MSRYARPNWCLGFAWLALTACRPNSPSQGDDGDGTESEGTEGTDTESDGGPGNAPPVPQLVSPLDDAVEVAVQTSLCWEPVEDPDGDPVRYRVFVDDIELAEGKLGEDGFDGPCTGPLDLVFDRAYAWEVAAFDASAPESQSAASQRWDFHTVWDGESKVLFEDDFEDGLTWEIGGDAAGGAWVWGEPEFTEHEVSKLVTVLSQPGGCPAGDGCVFTGHNPDGVSDQQDVAGGSTTLTSSPFDLSDTESVTVALSQFFYKSETAETGASLRVELLIPDADEPDGFAPYVLEHLELAEDVEDSNLWTATTLPGCGVPPVDGARLRITATDLGDGIIEAAVDSVKVTGFQNADLCSDGAGGLCDPDEPDSCGDGLLCCGQGTIDTGFYRCTVPVAGLDVDDPPANPDDPNNGEPGCDAPDITVRDHDAAVWIEDIFVQPDSCALFEGCVNDTGWRTVLRFDAQTPNVGSRDLVMGIPANHPDLYHFSPCHMHFHFDGYAVYTLLDGNDVVTEGRKQAFCLVDFRSWAWPWLEGKQVDGDDGTYNCYNQGLGRGWEDVYEGDLECQWVDITDVAPGDYTLRIEVNPPLPASDDRLLVERDYTNNVLDIPVQIP